MPTVPPTPPDFDTWPDDAKAAYTELADFNDAAVRLVNEQQRVIRSLRDMLRLVFGEEQPAPPEPAPGV